MFSCSPPTRMQPGKLWAPFLSPCLGKLAYSLGSLGVLYTARAGFELLILWPPSSKGWDFRCIPPPRIEELFHRCSRLYPERPHKVLIGFWYVDIERGQTSLRPSLARGHKHPGQGRTHTVIFWVSGVRAGAALWILSPKSGYSGVGIWLGNATL